ncbi:ankyrin repeat domain-containing protein [Fluviibacterium sp. S390]|uniref:ankyrin repeat domain-containing protein n=1 Tax=Fluviibacterium sp. S390 TaxID=3415139 RepID=UPI003C799940
MAKSLDHLRRSAKALKSGYDLGDPAAVARVRQALGAPVADIRHADALHVVAREAGFSSWPQLKEAVERHGMDGAARLQALKRALYLGQNGRVDRLLQEAPDLAAGHFALQVALLDHAAVAAALARDPSLATQSFGPRGRPILHLAFSRRFQGMPDPESAMLGIADVLLRHGASVNDSCPAEPGSEHRLSALYGAIGHSNNMVLARWLLAHGADPNDGESLYHATELGHHEGLRMLLEHGASPKGTNAVLRAIDFDDLEAVRLLLAAGADPNEGVATHPSGAPMPTLPALHQVARRGASVAMAELLLDNGADPAALFHGHSAYAYARIFGQPALSRRLEARGADTALSAIEAQLARAADGAVSASDWIDMARVSPDLRPLLTLLVPRPGTLPHMQRLVAMGFDANATDEMGLTPLQLAGWEGLPEVFAWFLKQGPDMSHVNAYGGTVFSTILHGSENCPHRAERDHTGCMRLALEHGVALPRRAVGMAEAPEMAALLATWAEAHPGQVVADGVV